MCRNRRLVEGSRTDTLKINFEGLQNLMTATLFHALFAEQFCRIPHMEVLPTKTMPPHLPCTSHKTTNRNQESPGAPSIRNAAHKNCNARGNSGIHAHKNDCGTSEISAPAVSPRDTSPKHGAVVIEIAHASLAGAAVMWPLMRSCEWVVRAVTPPAPNKAAHTV